MLKFLFWLLLATNGALFALHQGYLGGDDGRREPARLARQLNTDKLTLISESRARAAAAPLFAPPAADAAAASTPPAAAPAAAPAESAATAPTAATCIEVGDFGAADGQRFAERLDELGLRPQAVVRQVGDSGEAAGYMVYLAPPPGAISLGVFKSEEAARTQLAGLVKKGVRGARIQARGARQAFQLRALEPQQQAAFDRLRADFPAQETRACGGD